MAVAPQLDGGRGAALPRGPVVLEPIVLPPEAAHPGPPTPPPAARRRAPLRPLLQRPVADAAPAAGSPWWNPDSDDDDDDGWLDLERTLPSVLQYGSPDCLPMDHTLPHLLRQVAGTEDLASLRSIKLRVIGREMSLQRLCVYVPHLTELNLDGSSIGSLRELGCGLSGLRVLRVTRCCLDSLDGTFGLSALTELYAAYNRVQDVGYLACLSNIEHIDLRGNRVHDIRYAGFLTVCPLLRELVLAENPCAARPGYRAAIREMLPNLPTLDGVALCSYQQDDDTDSTASLSLADSTSAAPDDAVARVDGDAVTAASGEEHDDDVDEGEEEVDAEEVDGEAAEPKGNDAASETEDSTSSASASLSAGSRGAGRPANAATLWAGVLRPASRAGGEVAVSPRAGPLLLPRPATASCATPRRPHRPQHPAGRPSTAVPPPEPPPHTGAADVDGDAPSPLTSGGVVCGNLSLALRRVKARRREAWAQPPQQPQPGGHDGDLQRLRRGSSSSSSGSCSSLSSSSWSASDAVTPVDAFAEVVDEQDSTATAAAAASPVAEGAPGQRQDSDSLLAASRKWRNAYHQYRTSNKLKWQEWEGSDQENA